ncbi:preprotein translocase subunit SecG [Entomomonas asaccharolytica]|uniref:Protein-export membrane protein SecG n=1 Tax=Entomomonas asaccharolytica TaxID=2785331 RepID=A0A974NHP5_9GAMM|nr:preprotein translocase subunit SecG [Entomomonas asaccharolytica]QQP86664.1 preprotein translocase subunit SecG [Entomomonas asaccharolytica]
MLLESVIVIVHLLVAIAVIVLVLLQHGKGADMGASFGSGASNTVFGSQGSANFLSRTTAVLVAVFFITSIGLAYYAKSKSSASLFDKSVPAATQPVNQTQQPAVEDIPTVDHAPAPSAHGTVELNSTPNTTADQTEADNQINHEPAQPTEGN